MEKTILIPKPEDLFDEDGYPTDESLAYIENWCSKWLTAEETSDSCPRLIFGQYYGDKSKDEELLDFLKQLWWHGDIGVVQENDEITFHTFGWSGNESIISVLKNTGFWHMYWSNTKRGGHYTFVLDTKKTVENDFTSTYLLEKIKKIQVVNEKGEVVLNTECDNVMLCYQENYTILKLFYNTQKNV